MMTQTHPINTDNSELCIIRTPREIGYFCGTLRKKENNHTQKNKKSLNKVRKGINLFDINKLNKQKQGQIHQTT
jgi:hypothetical protein